MIPSGLQNACRYWTAHLSWVQHGDEAVMRALKDFSMRSLLWWIEAMGLMGSIFIAAGSIHEAHRWAECALMTWSDLRFGLIWSILDAVEVQFAACHNTFRRPPVHPSSRGSDRSKGTACVLLGATICTEKHTPLQNVLS